MISLEGGSAAARTLSSPPATNTSKTTPQSSTKTSAVQTDSFGDVPIRSIRTPVATTMPQGPIPVGGNGDKVNAQTKATYTVGPPTRPPIHHDNGFLQNPNDPNDPNPIPTVPPTDADRKAKDDWETKLRLGRLGQGVPFVPHNNIPDGLDAYDHFLNG